MSTRPSIGGRALRAVAILLLALAATFNLLGGIGTACVAINPTRWGPDMAKLAPAQWLYVLLMIAAIGVSIWGIGVTLALARGRDRAYSHALIVLVASLVIAGVQTVVSIALRGKGAPQNMRFYFTTLVVIVFLLLRLPPAWKLIRGFGKGSGSDFATPTGLAAFGSGLLALTTPLWATPTHIGPDGSRWVNVLRTPLLAGGALLVLAGIGLVAWSGRRAPRDATVSRSVGDPVVR